jgi:CheY-like chemotaxis protein
MPVDLIISDLYMPDKDRLEVIREARKAGPKIPVIAISGAAGEKNMLNTPRLLGASSILQKPFSKQQLLRAVGTVMALLPVTGNLPVAAPRA